MLDEIRERYGALVTNAGIRREIERQLFNRKGPPDALATLLLAHYAALELIDDLARRIETLDKKVSAVLKDMADDHANVRGGKFSG